MASVVTRQVRVGLGRKPASATAKNLIGKGYGGEG